MLTLYHTPRSRSDRTVWLLEEIGATYELKAVDIRRADGTGTLDPANPHPHGKVPMLVHDGVKIFESSAIALYLTDAFPERGIGRQIGDAQRGPYLSWLSYYTGVAEPAFLSKFLNQPVPRGSAGWVVLEEAMAFILHMLAEGPYLLGERFSGADTLFASTFALFAGNPILPKSQLLDDYVKRCLDRPAYARGIARAHG